MALRRNVLSLTLLLYVPPATGLLVELALAWTVGASAIVDVYRLASFVLMSGSLIFSVQVLRNVVVPMVAQYRAGGDHTGAWRFACSFALLVATVAAPLVVALVMYPETVLRLLGPGLSSQAAQSGRALMQAAGIGLAALLLAGVVTGLLQSYGVFWVYPVGHALLNLTLLSALVIGLGAEAHALATAMAIGAAANLVIHLVVAVRTARASGITTGALVAGEPLPGLAQAAALTLPFLAVAICQQWLGVVINGTLTTLGEGSLALYGYAAKLMQMGSLPVSAFVTVLYPVLVGAFAKHDRPELVERFEQGWRLVVFIGTGMTILMTQTAPSIVTILFGHSALSAVELEHLRTLCQVQALTILATGALAFLLQYTYALQTFAFAVALYFAMALAHAIFLPIGAYYGSLIGAVLTHVALLFFFGSVALVGVMRQLCVPLSGNVMSYMVRVVIAGGGAFAVTAGLEQLAGPWIHTGIVPNALYVGVGFLAGGGVFLLVGRLLGLPEARAVLSVAGQIAAKAGIPAAGRMPACPNARSSSAGANGRTRWSRRRG